MMPTTQQLSVLLFIDAYKKEHGLTPAYREITQHVWPDKPDQVSRAHAAIQGLIKGGFLIREGKDTARNLTVVKFPTDNTGPPTVEELKFALGILRRFAAQEDQALIVRQFFEKALSVLNIEIYRVMEKCNAPQNR